MYALLEAKSSTINELGIEVRGASYYLCDGIGTEVEPDPDVKNLPTEVGIGSRALCIPTGNIYMFGPSKKWTKYKGVSILN